MKGLTPELLHSQNRLISEPHRMALAQALSLCDLSTGLCREGHRQLQTRSADVLKTPYLMAVAIKVKPQLRTTCLTQLLSYTAAIGILRSRISAARYLGRLIDALTASD